jgi:hypothetical protein
MKSNERKKKRKKATAFSYFVYDRKLLTDREKRRGIELENNNKELIRKH